MIKVLVADDHSVVRRGLRQILAETPDILVGGEAATLQEVRELVRDHRWDVLVLDLNMPGGSGIELLSELHKQNQSVRVLVLTIYPEEQYAVRAIRAGAAGFLTKESAPERLIDAVRKVAGGGRYVSAELAETLASLVAGEMLASGRTVSQAAEELALSVKTVSTHRTRILKKMEMKTNAELTHYGMRNRLVE
jgi:two-component system invasion response regulator UvrY